ncbi:MAG: hypothetical protein RLZZ528_2913 [Pseudomonadota bacterium]
MTDPAEGIGPLDDDYDRIAPRRGAGAATRTLFLLCLLPELLLSGAEAGLWGDTRWRATAIEFAGFWPGLLTSWAPNYPAQPWAMFLTYGFLHAGLLHFAVNMLTLFSLAPPVVQRVGVGRFLGIYVLALAGGALGYVMLSNWTAPLVGASGALFGLAGTLLSWDYSERRARGLRLTPVWRAIALLAGLNLILWYAMHGLLAWQTHLGGFVAGWLVARYLEPPILSKIRS